MSIGPPEPIVPMLAPPVLPASPYNPYSRPVQVMFDEQSDDEVRDNLRCNAYFTKAYFR